MQVPLLDLKAQYSTIKNEILEGISEVLDSQRCIGGPKVAELEEKIAANLRAQGIQDKIVSKTKSELDRLDVGNQWAQQRQKQEVGKFETQLNNIQPTRAITPPMQSLEPSGPGKSIIVILALILGLLLGIFAAFFASFLNKVKLQATQS